MSFSELVKASWHALIANPKRSFLTTIGIIIGIASVVTIMSLGAGVKKQMLRDLDTTQTGQQTAEIYYNSRDMFLNEPGFDNRDVTMLMDANLKGVAK
ncbi:MAG: ABC transporter permease, partial [Weissella cibaria]